MLVECESGLERGLAIRASVYVPAAVTRLTERQLGLAAWCWCRGKDTMLIARRVQASEASVYNALPEIRRRALLCRLEREAGL